MIDPFGDVRKALCVAMVERQAAKDDGIELSDHAFVELVVDQLPANWMRYGPFVCVQHKDGDMHWINPGHVTRIVPHSDGGSVIYQTNEEFGIHLRPAPDVLAELMSEPFKGGPQ